MTFDPWVSIGAVLGALAASMALLSTFARTLGASPEAARKFLHVEMGMVTLAFPWLFTAAWPVVFLAAAAVAWFRALRASRWLKRRFGAVLEDVQRASFGEVWFACGTCLVFALSGGQPARYCVPVMILTLADTAAALAGKRWGKPRLVYGGAIKSCAGSAAFFCCAFVIAAFGLGLSNEHDPERCVLVALIVALAATLLEAIAAHGLDNLTVPLGVFAVLSIADGASSVALTGAAALLATMLTGAFALGSPAADCRP
jgi:phytol kinase